MLIKIISLAFNSAAGGFDDNEVRSFIQDKEVVSIRDHLFLRNDVPYLTLIIKYVSTRLVAPVAPGPTLYPKKDEEWKQLLTESDMGLFNLLREWRSTQCKKEGVPPYVLFTN